MCLPSVLGEKLAMRDGSLALEAGTAHSKHFPYEFETWRTYEISPGWVFSFWEKLVQRGDVADGRERAANGPPSQIVSPLSSGDTKRLERLGRRRPWARATATALLIGGPALALIGSL